MKSLRFIFVLELFCVCYLIPWPVFARLQVETPDPHPPKIAEASDEAMNAMQVFLLPKDVTATVFAAEPMVANPVAIHVDSQNRVFVCESFRQENGIVDNTTRPEWLYDDLAAQTVADRLAYMKRRLGEKAIEFTQQDDRIRLLMDKDGNGVADQSTVFADHFNAIEEGTGAGVLSFGGSVYYTCIPRLWKMIDKDNDGVADDRKVLYDGFGVRFAYRGHDLHGLIVGPDGRIYFSIGDRGYHVNDEISDPGSGAVFRCEADGSGLEVFATGLRNPQELAFDDYGNLFTGDNNSDSGDKARMVYVVEGGDTGWRMAYQYLPDRGPFNREKIWHPYDPNVTPAYIIPPIDNFADGPSGFAFYPGTGFSRHMNDRFLLCDFRGQTTGSGIKTFRLSPKGAFFEVVDEENTFWNILATDCCFGPDGRLYVSDWVHGWNGIGKGRIYALSDSGGNVEQIREVKQLLSGNWNGQSDAKLLSLLGHADRRVRMESQFELVRRDSIFPLTVVARSVNAKKLARIHALWALDQLSRTTEQTADVRAGYAELLIELASDPDVQIQIQVARLIGEFFHQNPLESEFQPRAEAVLQRLIGHENQRLQFFSAMAMGRVAADRPLTGIVSLIANNDNQDPMLRHAGIMAFLWQSQKHGPAYIAGAARHASDAVRLAAVVMLRKMSSQQPVAPYLRHLLHDNNPAVALEAARAVHDLPIPELLPDLAALFPKPGLSDSMVRRILNANFRLGDREAIERVRDFVGNKSLSIARRIDAVQMLAEWSDPPNPDKVLGMWRPLQRISRARTEEAVEALFAKLPQLEHEIVSALIGAASRLKLTSTTPVLTQVFRNDKDVDRRLQAFNGLLAFAKGREVKLLVEEALRDHVPTIRMAALVYLVEHDPESTDPHLEKGLQSDSTRERQNAVKILGELTDTSSRDILLDLVANFDKVPEDTRLDLVMAAQARDDEMVQNAIQGFLESSSAVSGMNWHRLSMYGGNSDAGSDIFFNRNDVACLRCHKINGSGGDVGPDLSDIGTKRDRKYLLESLVEPGKTIAENFETVVVLDVDGKLHVGITRSSTEEMLSIITADAIIENIPQTEIEEIRGGKSAMPDDVMKHLTPSELRDLIEFLANQKNNSANDK